MAMSANGYEASAGSESAVVSPSLLAAVETRTDKPVSCCFNIGMQDFVEDAALLQENRPSLS